MKLSVYVLGREVAALESVGDFKSVLTYLPGTAPEDFVSLTMPVRTESYVWDDQLPPVFQMNLPEGYLLQVLQEQFGPQIGASPTALLSVIGRNMVGRVQIAAPGAVLEEPPNPIEVAELLQGDNSEQAFAELVRQHATSGVSGVLPKFLDVDDGSNTESVDISASLGLHQKATLFTRRHIIKGSSGRLPFAALNEYLCMQVVGKVLPSAKTEVSRDGNALVVHRFDVDEQGHPLWGMEDFCALLGLRPAAKYETTWERIARAVRDHVPGGRQHETFRRLAATLFVDIRRSECGLPCEESGVALHCRGRRTSVTRLRLPHHDRLRQLSVQPTRNRLHGEEDLDSRPDLAPVHRRHVRHTRPRTGAPCGSHQRCRLRCSAAGPREDGRAPPTSETSGNVCSSHGRKGCMASAKSGSMQVASGRETEPSMGSRMHPKSSRPSTAIGRSPLMADRSRRPKK